MNGVPIENCPDRFELRREPDGVYRIDGRVIPSAYDASLCVDHCDPVVGVHNGKNKVRGLVGVVGRVHIEQ